jgi:fatty acid desaturase
MVNSIDVPEDERREEALRLHRWQLRLLPLIVRVLIGITIFFFAVSLVQLGYLHWRIEKETAVDFSQAFNLIDVAPKEDSERRAASALMINALLEANTLERRYRQGRVLLMSRVWTTYLGFVTGMALSMLGAAFILGRIEGAASTTKMELGALKAELATAAPGLVLVFFGVMLMISALFVRHTITVDDGAVYFRGPLAPAAPAATASKPTLSIPAAYAASASKWNRP